MPITDIHAAPASLTLKYLPPPTTTTNTTTTPCTNEPARVFVQAWTSASKPNSGDRIPWTSGTVQDGQRDSDQEVEIVQELNPEERAFHTVTTAQGSATHWQMRIHYYW